MEIKLFEYNQKAYEAAAALFAENGKIDIIHPAYTGRSLIGFKLCEEHSDKTVCWISPSKNIFETQTENLKSASDVSIPKNIKSCTYAGLTEMSAEEMTELAPDVIILDEVHRCDTQTWETGVQSFLCLFPNVPVLLLSAMALCIFDDRRDMADKLPLCREMFEQLDKVIISRNMYDYVFERNYHAAVEYYQHHGDLECSAGHVTPGGIRLGAWIRYLRIQCKANRKFLTDEQYQMLNAIGMRWDNKHDLQWNEAYSELCKYHHGYKNINVPATYRTESGLLLGRWIRRQIESYAKGQLRPDRIERLEQLGIVWEPLDPWEKKFRLAKAYSEAHNGILNVPVDYVVKGVRLNKWLNEQKLIGEGKRKKQLTQKQREKLESIGLVFGKGKNDIACFE